MKRVLFVVMPILTPGLVFLGLIVGVYVFHPQKFGVPGQLPAAARPSGEQAAPAPQPTVAEAFKNLEHALDITEKQRDEFLHELEKAAITMKEANREIGRQRAEIANLRMELVKERDAKTFPLTITCPDGRDYRFYGGGHTIVTGDLCNPANYVPERMPSGDTVNCPIDSAFPCTITRREVHP